MLEGQQRHDDEHHELVALALRLFARNFQKQICVL
jgi:hypothetical protein